MTKRIQTQFYPTPSLDPDPFCVATLLAHGGDSQGPTGCVGLTASVLLTQAFGGVGSVPSEMQTVGSLRLASQTQAVFASQL